MIFFIYSLNGFFEFVDRFSNLSVLVRHGDGPVLPHHLLKVIRREPGHGRQSQNQWDLMWTLIKFGMGLCHWHTNRPEKYGSVVLVLVKSGQVTFYKVPEQHSYVLLVILYIIMIYVYYIIGILLTVKWFALSLTVLYCNISFNVLSSVLYSAQYTLYCTVLYCTHRAYRAPGMKSKYNRCFYGNNI